MWFHLCVALVLFRKEPYTNFLLTDSVGSKRNIQEIVEARFGFGEGLLPELSPSRRAYQYYMVLMLLCNLQCMSLTSLSGASTFLLIALQLEMLSNRLQVVLCKLQ
jgi:hypothetical protein